MSKTKIEWSEFSWNPIIGCSKISEGCQNCYAERMAWRLACMEKGELDEFTMDNNYPTYGYNNVVCRKGWIENCILNPKALKKPLSWNKPRMVFVNSMGDLFHENVPFEWIDKVMAIIALCPQHTFQILTKRADRMAEYFNEWNLPMPDVNNVFVNHKTLSLTLASSSIIPIEDEILVGNKWPLSNLWLGVTVENPDYLWRVEKLLQIPAAVRFVSLEPLLDEICLTNIPYNSIGAIHKMNALKGYAGWGDYNREKYKLHWIIVGAETGPGRRPCKLEWVRSIVQQGAEAGVPAFVKQIEINGKISKDPSEWPEDVRVRQWPEVKK